MDKSSVSAACPNLITLLPKDTKLDNYTHNGRYINLHGGYDVKVEKEK